MPASPDSAWSGTSSEMRRFSAGMRVIVVLLCALLLFGAGRPTYAAAIVLLAYGIWAARVLWVEAIGQSQSNALLNYWIDAAWTAAMLQLAPSATNMLVLTLVQPVVLASIGFGVRRGVQLAVFGALAVVADFGHPLTQSLSDGADRSIAALGVLALVPAVALLARPMSSLRQGLDLVGEIEGRLDPRRGLEAVSAVLADQLRAGTAAEVVGLVLPSASGAPAMLSREGAPRLRAQPPIHRLLEDLLADVAASPVLHIRHQSWRNGAGTRMQSGAPLPEGLADCMDELASLLEVRSLIVLPLSRYQRSHGHLLIGFAESRAAGLNVEALAYAVPELLRIVEQAALVDQLQEESASHERARIGRDLHDSAIQPYLGLKFAVEGLALRIPQDNPARAEVDALASLVTSEVAALRELISGLRSGCGPGDNALVPAVRRQMRRFSAMFGIDVDVECGDHLVTTRALADALFHMVNEALTNLRKHTGARHVWLRMSIESGVFVLVLRDDAGTLSGRPSPAFEPMSLTQRVRELGGRLHIGQPDGLNTVLTLSIPLQPELQAE